MFFYLSISAVVVLLAALGGSVLYWDKARRSFVLALRSLWLHKLRAFLSVLGIIIGTGAVISLMAFGEGSMQDALDDIKRLGATNIIIRSVKPPDEANQTRRNRVSIYGLTYADYDRFATMRGDVITRMVPLRIFPQEIRRLAKMHNGRVVGTTPGYQEIHELDLAAGRFLIEEDDAKLKNVAVLGSTVCDKLFPFENPLGQTVRLGSYFYTVIGVLKDRMPAGGSGGASHAEDFNNDVYIPLKTCRARYGEKITIRQSGSFLREQVELSQVTITAANTDQVRPLGNVIDGLLTQRHLRKDTAVTVPLDRLEEAERAKDRYKMLLVLIAGISLIVGGIGIMNIMLATVTERTREIGIRRALGAKRRDITLQFLVEAVVQTSVGGLFGVGVGLGIVFVVPWLSRIIWEWNLPAKVHVPSIFLSLAVAVGVGVLFGLYPARRAALLDPIEALRHE
jgi:putative ABC transport system permease protein